MPFFHSYSNSSAVQNTKVQNPKLPKPFSAYQRVAMLSTLHQTEALFWLQHRR